MEVINSADFFGTNIKVREENFKSLLKKEAEEKYLDNYDELKGAVYGLLFCLPFFIILFWLIS